MSSLLQKPSGEHNTWAGTLGVAVLMGASFVGCAPVQQVPAGVQLNSQPVPALRVEDEQNVTATLPSDQKFLDQTVKLEKAVGSILSNSNRYGWRTNDELKGLILVEFQSSEAGILERIDQTSDPIVREDLARLFESVHMVHRLFEVDGLAYSRICGGHGSTDGSMGPLYGLEAKLMLVRHRLTQ